MSNDTQQAELQASFNLPNGKIKTLRKDPNNSDIYITTLKHWEK